MEGHKSPTFASNHRDFVTTLNKRVNEYFKSNNLSKYGNGEMVLKTVVMFLLYFSSYALIVTGVISGIFPLILATVVMSLGLAGIGLSVMHDANHGAYSRKPWVNALMGYSLNMVGANSFNWKIQHNVIHHSFTNIHDEDEDISPRGVLRMTPHSPWKRFHRYQFIYAWFIYGLMTIAWLFFKDFARLAHYHKSGMVKKQKASIVGEWAILIATKLIYIGYIFVIPLILTALPVWQILVGILIMHYIAGFMLAIIFQPAHVVEGTAFPLPDSNNTMESTWAVHQLHTTMNFANTSRWFTWYVGGLNFQIEHHLFPNICHVHYRKIMPIIRQTAAEFGLPYRSAKTFFRALVSHVRLLKQLGMRPTLTS
jgi:linoleoyl-CoA desaturase